MIELSDTPHCRKCGDTGWYHYDENHAKPCEQCCPHRGGVWWLTFEYGAWGDSPRWCCLDGCGTKWAGIIDYQRSKKDKVDG